MKLAPYPDLHSGNREGRLTPRFPTVGVGCGDHRLVDLTIGRVGLWDDLFVRTTHMLKGGSDEIDESQIHTCLRYYSCSSFDRMWRFGIRGRYGCDPAYA
ncbi:hypothetical protein MES4922_80096 [Mesorhizobium ventifaucium]|uniref:Uncharacterized protein n=1 Tax=Mesorhizobium ventifaucium TaxID=666020 RepID=A0ABM9EEU3_9HYPH|nr:hypothetical protein MES4922_80096 [Mesorhizobium ventifaucium]